MKKRFSFVASNATGTVITVRDNLQPASVILSEEEGKRLLLSDGLVEIPFQSSLFYHFESKEPFIVFTDVRFIKKTINNVMTYEASSFEFIEESEVF